VYNSGDREAVQVSAEIKLPRNFSYVGINADDPHHCFVQNVSQNVLYNEVSVVQPKRRVNFGSGIFAAPPGKHWLKVAVTRSGTIDASESASFIVVVNKLTSA
jgi:hypothetical protein